MNVNGNDITIEIGASSKSAADGIERLTSALKELKSSVRGNGKGMSDLASHLSNLSRSVRELGDASSKIANITRIFGGIEKLNGVKVSKDLGENLHNIAESAKDVTPKSIANLERMTLALQRLSGVDIKAFRELSSSASTKNAISNTERANALASISARTGGSTRGIDADAVKFERALSQIDKAIERTQEKIERFRQELSAETLSPGGGDQGKIENYNRAIEEQSQILDGLIRKRDDLNRNGLETKVKVDSTEVDEATKKVSKLKVLLSSLKRVAFYRAIRTAIKFVTDGFKEGLENAYYFSKGINGELANSLDRLSSAAFKMKNQLGAAFGQLLVAVTPVLIKLIEIVTYAANAITQFFAVLSGQSTYLRAIDYWKEWGDEADDAGGKAKAALKYLAPFDELNVLPSERSKGSGSGDQGIDYDKMFEVAEVEDLWKKIGNIFSDFAIQVKDVAFNWDDLSPWEIFKKVLAGLGGVIGFSLGGVPGAVVGVLAGVGLSMLIEELWPEVKDMSKNALFSSVLGLVGGAIGFALYGVPGAVVGTIAGIGLSLLIEGIFPEISDKLDAKSALGIVGGALVAAKILKRVGAGAAAAGGGAGAGAGVAAGASGLSYALAGAIAVGVGLNIVKFITDVQDDPVKAFEKAAGDPVVGAATDLAMQVAEIFDKDIFKNWGSQYDTNDGKYKVVYELEGAGVSIKTWVDMETGEKVGFIAPNGKKFWLKDGVWEEVIEDVAGTTANIDISTKLSTSIQSGAKGILGVVSNAIKTGKKTIDMGIIAKVNTEFENEAKPFGDSFMDMSDWGEYDPATGEFVVESKMKISPEFESNLSDVEYNAQLVKHRINETLLNGQDGIGKRINENISNALSSAFGQYENKKIDVKADVNEVDTSKLTEKSWFLQTIARLTGVDQSKLTDKSKSINAVANFVKTKVEELTEKAKTIASIANFTKTDKSKLGNVFIDTIGNFKSTATKSLTTAARTLWTIAQFNKTDASPLKQGQRTIDSIASIIKFNVTAPKPEVNITGKIDKILTPGGGYIEIKKNGGVFANGKWNPITEYAGGGYPLGGEVFIAREAGPELVGRMGNHTAVMNNNQIVASVSDGVAVANEAVVGALFAAAAQIVGAIRDQDHGTGGNGSIDTLARAVTRWQRSAAMADGNY